MITNIILFLKVQALPMKWWANPAPAKSVISGQGVLLLSLAFFSFLFYSYFCHNLFIYLANEPIDSLINFNLNLSLSIPVLIKETTNILIKRDMVKGDPDFKLNPMWVTGITDGEGSFSAYILKGTNRPKIALTFKVDQKEDSAGILYDLARYFNCGKVVSDNRGFKSFKVTKLTDIVNIIIPHFNQYSLVTSKQLNFLGFKKIALMLDYNGTNNLDFYQIKAIISSMNSQRTYLEKWDYLSNTLFTSLDPHWIQAFIDGEGSFQFGIADRISRGSKYIATTPTLEIAQNTHDVKVLDLIKQYFEAGYIKPKFDITSLEDSMSVRSVSRYILRDSSKIIQFIDKYPMLTRKHEDYLKWKNLVELKKSRAFDSEEGRALMESIKASMNRGKYNKAENEEINEEIDKELDE